MRSSNVKPRLVTFDCAQTLIDVNWSVAGFMRDCMAFIGEEISAEESSTYESMYYERLPEYLHVNLKRDPEEGQLFWQRLSESWLLRIGRNSDLLPELIHAADELGYGKNSRLFKVYDDVLPCLERLERQGILIAVVSNWDYTLHRVLRMFGIDRYLAVALASLEEGIEKPDPRLFNIALTRLNVPAEDAVHVGDHIEDDIQGALAAGMYAALIDRTGATPGAMHTLDDLEEVVGWTV